MEFESDHLRNSAAWVPGDRSSTRGGIEPQGHQCWQERCWFSGLGNTNLAAFSEKISEWKIGEDLVADYDFFATNLILQNVSD